MKKTDKFIKLIQSDIEGKTILEVACGSGELSVAASALAKTVTCIDIDDGRLCEQIHRDNIRFEVMDAREMTFADETFDTAVIYNALFHIKDYWDDIINECRRVIKKDGTIYVVSTWSLDTNLMDEMFGDRVTKSGDFSVVRITGYGR